MSEPTRCQSAPCGRWTFRADGYCSDECARIVPLTPARGIGIVTPPTVAHASKRTRVRRNDGYIAGNGAWIATAEAGYRELQADLRDLDRRKRRAAEAASRSIAKVRTVAQSDATLALIRSLPASNGGNPDA